VSIDTMRAMLALVDIKVVDDFIVAGVLAEVN
jgi:hypothetical protein